MDRSHGLWIWGDLKDEFLKIRDEMDILSLIVKEKLFD